MIIKIIKVPSSPNKLHLVTWITCFFKGYATKSTYKDFKVLLGDRANNKKLMSFYSKYYYTLA